MIPSPDPPRDSKYHHTNSHSPSANTLNTTMASPHTTPNHSSIQPTKPYCTSKQQQQQVADAACPAAPHNTPCAHVTLFSPRRAATAAAGSHTPLDTDLCAALDAAGVHSSRDDTATTPAHTPSYQVTAPENPGECSQLTQRPAPGLRCHIPGLSIDTGNNTGSARLSIVAANTDCARPCSPAAHLQSKICALAAPGDHVPDGMDHVQRVAADYSLMPLSEEVR